MSWQRCGAALAVGLLQAMAPARASDEAPRGLNCQLRQPPSSSGELETSGAPWRVFPRAVAIGATYTGCQTVWAPQAGGGWRVVLRVVVVGGRPARTWPAPAPPPPSDLACAYEGPHLAPGTSEQCPALVRSLPAGCLHGDLPARYDRHLPQRCVYDLDDTVARVFPSVAAYIAQLPMREPAYFCELMADRTADAPNCPRGAELRTTQAETPQVMGALLGNGTARVFMLVRQPSGGYAEAFHTEEVAVSPLWLEFNQGDASAPWLVRLGEGSSAMPTVTEWRLVQARGRWVIASAHRSEIGRCSDGSIGALRETTVDYRNGGFTEQRYQDCEHPRTSHSRVAPLLLPAAALDLSKPVQR